MLRHMWQCALLSTLVASVAAAETGTWAPMGPEGGSFSAVSVDPDDPDVAYALSNSRAFRRDGRSGRWQALEPTYARTVGVAAGGRVYVAGDAVYRSRDHGKHFDRLPLPVAPLTALAVDPSNPDVLYATFFYDGVRRSSNGGQSWSSPSSFPDTSDADAVAIAVDSKIPSTVYVALRRGGVFISEDSGVTWTTQRRPALSVAGRYALRDRLCAAAGDSATLFAGAFDGGLYRLDAQTDTWSSVLDGFVTSLITAGSDTVYVGSASDDAYNARPSELQFALQRSDDAGEQWRAVDDTVWPGADRARRDPGERRLALRRDRQGHWRSYGNGLGLLRYNGRAWELDQAELYGLCAHGIVATATSMSR